MQSISISYWKTIQQDTASAIGHVCIPIHELDVDGDRMQLVDPECLPPISVLTLSDISGIAQCTEHAHSLFVLHRVVSILNLLPYLVFTSHQFAQFLHMSSIAFPCLYVQYRLASSKPFINSLRRSSCQSANGATYLLIEVARHQSMSK